MRHLKLEEQNLKVILRKAFQIYLLDTQASLFSTIRRAHYKLCIPEAILPLQKEKKMNAKASFVRTTNLLQQPPHPTRQIRAHKTGDVKKVLRHDNHHLSLGTSVYNVCVCLCTVANVYVYVKFLFS